MSTLFLTNQKAENVLLLIYRSKYTSGVHHGTVTEDDFRKIHSEEIRTDIACVGTYFFAVYFPEIALGARENGICFISIFPKLAYAF